MTIEAEPIAVLLSRVMDEVGAIRKSERNAEQGFSFRGIDTVVNAVSPAFRKYGVVCVPRLIDERREQITTTKGSLMNYVAVNVEFTYYGPAGDSITGGAYGAAFDSGDKAEPKAMSVAYRVFLLQSLCLPTDEPDVDTEAHEMARPAEPAPDTDGANLWVEKLKEAIDSGEAVNVLNVRKEMAENKVLDHMFQQQTLSKWADKAMQKVGKP